MNSLLSSSGIMESWLGESMIGQKVCILVSGWWAVEELQKNEV